MRRVTTQALPPAAVQAPDFDVNAPTVFSQQVNGFPRFSLLCGADRFGHTYTTKALDMTTTIRTVSEFKVFCWNLQRLIVRHLEWPGRFPGHVGWNHL